MPKVKSGRVWGGCFPDYELRRRETGIRTQIGWQSSIRRSLYTSILPCTSWDPRENDSKTGFVGHGGVFNLEFSPDGSHLVAACEQRALMVFDPLSRRQIHHIPHAHQNCVNCIRFLDTRVFASCSDDHTVALWDVRNLKRKVRQLEGHSNWVKNIEYSSQDGILVTSGFDGKILSWDINNYCEEGLVSSELFSMQGLMRMRLTPDGSKLVMCTTGGYMVLIHNLSLQHLNTDLRDFKPTMYRLMQLSNTPLPQAVGFTHLFHAKRNRVEFISDFPASNDAEVIHSLQVHPQGWCVLSRNTSMEDISEWSCVHDIQEMDLDVYEEQDEDDDEHKDIEPYDDLPSERETENESPMPPPSAPLATTPPTTSSSNINSDDNDNDNGNDINDNNNTGSSRDLHLSLTFSPRVEITLRNSPNETVDEGTAAGSSSSNSNSDNAGREGSSTRSHNSSVSAGVGGGSGSGSSGGASNSGVGEGGSSSGSGVNIQFRFTSMDVFEALEHIRERREEQRAGRSTPREQPESPNTSSSITSRSRFVGNRPPPFSVRSRQEREREQNAINNNNVPENPPRTVGNVIDPRNAFYIRTGSGNHRAILLLRPGQNHPRYLRQVDPNHKIARNYPRLTHYIEEPNVGRGFIKELCFNSDGTLICSPYAHGVRLMMFDSKCSELSTCVTSTPQQLYDVSTSICHSNCVVSTKFSPTHCLLVSGCLNGKIVWHQPVL